jgi:hypothetical protein
MAGLSGSSRRYCLSRKSKCTTRSKHGQQPHRTQKMSGSTKSAAHAPPIAPITAADSVFDPLSLGVGSVATGAGTVPGTGTIGSVTLAGVGGLFAVAFAPCVAFEAGTTGPTGATVVFEAARTSAINNDRTKIAGTTKRPGVHAIIGSRCGASRPAEQFAAQNKPTEAAAARDQRVPLVIPTAKRYSLDGDQCAGDWGAAVLKSKVSETAWLQKARSTCKG